MECIHKIISGSSSNLSTIPSKSVALVITSPPYPMIDMWDECFVTQDNSIDISGNKDEAFEKMHNILDSVWSECDRVLIDGGFICINIGDATRTINDVFQLYSNHTRIINYFSKHGYSILPDIHWRKQSNAPNKFMGSGMYPCGAYVTYEHEYILIFRKGGKRQFSPSEKELRKESAYFWEERNEWFSDLWDIRGTKQQLWENNIRSRSGAYPFEIPYRLVNMYSIKGDTVLDPFGGTGTTSLACIASERNSICCEYYDDFKDKIINRLLENVDYINEYLKNRFTKHMQYVDNLPYEKREKCYSNTTMNIPVKTRQETLIVIRKILTVTKKDNDTVISDSDEYVEIVSNDSINKTNNRCLNKDKNSLFFYINN